MYPKVDHFYCCHPGMSCHHLLTWIVTVISKWVISFVLLPPLAYLSTAYWRGSSQTTSLHSYLPIVSHLTQNKIQNLYTMAYKAENDLASLCPNWNTSTSHPAQPCFCHLDNPKYAKHASALGSIAPCCSLNLKHSYHKYLQVCV